MAVWYVDPVNGQATAGGTSWADAVDSVASLPPVVANGTLDPGDVVKMADTGADGVGQNGVVPDLSAGPLVAFVGYDPTTDTPLAAPNFAGFSKYGGAAFANAYLEGLRLQQQSSGYWYSLGEYRAGGQLLVCRRCNLLNNGGSGIGVDAQKNGNAAPSRVVLDDCTVSPKDTIVVNEGAEFVMRGGAISASSADGVFSVRGGMARVAGVDVSAMTAGALFDCQGGVLEADVVAAPTGVSTFSSVSPPAAAPGRIVVRGRDFYAGIDDVGLFDLTGAVYRTGGMTLSDGTPVAAVLTTGATLQPGIRGSEIVLAETMPLDLSADRTVSVFLAQPSGAAPLTSQDAWLVVEFEGAGGYRTPGTRPQSAMTGGTALPTDASTWNGLTAPVAQRLDLTVTADPAGSVRARVTLVVAKPSATIYADLAVQVT